MNSGSELVRSSGWRWGRRQRLRALVFATALVPGIVRPLSAQQGGVVAGVVVDARSLSPLAGAQVAVVGTSKGALTDSRGQFTLAGLSGEQVTLQVVMLGYRTTTQPVRVGGPSVRLALEQAAVELNQLVVTGTAGATQRRAIGNAVSQVKAGTIAETAPVQNLGQLLNARAPGVIVLPPSGLAGGGSRVLIRGKSSFSLSSDPLIYVDGVRVDNRGPAGGVGLNSPSRLNDIPPDQIESIEIIKGPAAATLYGTEASNGVINIITKRGRSGDPHMTVSVREGAAWVMDPEGRWPVNYYKDPATGDVVAFNIAKVESDAGRPIFRTGHTQGYEGSVSGGTDLMQYFVGLNYDRDEGAVRTNLAQRFAGNVNIAVSPSKHFDMRGTSVFSMGRTDFGRDIMFDAVLTRPGNRNTRTRGFYTAPPEIEAQAGSVGQDEDHFTVGVEANHRPTSWFTQRLKAGVDLSNQRNVTLTPRLTGEVATFFTPTVDAGTRSDNQTNLLTTTVDYGATATAQLRQGLSAATSVGAQYYRQMTRLLSAAGDRFPAPGVDVVAGAAVTRGSDDFVENVTVGFYVQEQLALNQRLFLTGAVRGDDNSAFGRNFDFVVYPKLSGTWVVSEEPFWHVGLVNALKLRVAYGQSGQQPQAFSALRTYEPVTGQAGTPAVTPQFVGNPDLGPERAAELEAGFEAGLFNQRMGIDFTFYDRKTRDAIVLRDVAPSSGFPQQQYVNVGAIKNSGIELLLTGKPIESRNVALDLALNLSTNANKVLELGIPNVPFLSRGFGERIEPGYPVDASFARRVVSADRGPNGEPINILCDDGHGGGVDCATAPQVFVGRFEPSFQGSFMPSLRLYNRVTLSAMVDWKTGNRIWSSSLWCPGILGCEDEVYPERFDPKYAASSVLGYTDDARWWMDVSFAKLREVSVDYRLPDHFAQRIGASSATIVLAARNLHTWTPFKGLDPENVASYSSQFEQNEVPQLAQFMTRINLSF